MMGLFVLFLDYDSERSQKPGVLTGKEEIRLVGIDFRWQALAVGGAFFALPVKANRDFQNQEKVVSGGPDAAHNLRNIGRVRQRFVNCLTKFLDQGLEVVVELQKAPFCSDFAPVCILCFAAQQCQASI